MWSIILLVYDPLDTFAQSGALEQTVASVLTLRGDYELLIVNNNPLASSVRLPAMLRELEQRNPGRVRVLSPDANLGSARGFNYALQQSDRQSEFVAFMSGDAEVIDLDMLTKL